MSAFQLDCEINVVVARVPSDTVENDPDATPSLISENDPVAYGVAFADVKNNEFPIISTFHPPAGPDKDS